MDEVHPLILMVAAVIQYFAVRLFELLKMAVVALCIPAGVGFFMWLLRTFIDVRPV